MIIELKHVRKGANTPTKGSGQAAGYDLYACIDQPVYIEKDEPAQLIPTGVAISMRNLPLVGLIFPRSGLGHKQGLVLGNGVGVIDPDYQGELMVSAWNRGQQECITINPGERIAQLVFMPLPHTFLQPVDSFEGFTERGEGGFGSTGIDIVIGRDGATFA